MIAGVLAGFACTIVLATLGAALGLTAGISVADPASDTGSVLKWGAVAWLVVSAIVVGFVGGTVLARSARPDRSFHARTLGLLTWGGGIVLAAALASPTAMGLMNGVGGAAALATSIRPFADGRPELGDPNGRGVRPLDATANRNLSDADRATLRAAAEDAARAASIAAWAALVAQLVSLGMTLLAAKAQRRRLVEREPVEYAGVAPRPIT